MRASSTETPSPLPNVTATFLITSELTSDPESNRRSELVKTSIIDHLLIPYNVVGDEVIE